MHRTDEAKHLEKREPADVRFGSKADICSARRHVRFTPMCGRLRVGKDFLERMQHWSVQPIADMCGANRNVRFGAKSGHVATSSRYQIRCMNKRSFRACPKKSDSLAGSALSPGNMNSGFFGVVRTSLHMIDESSQLRHDLPPTGIVKKHPG